MTVNWTLAARQDFRWLTGAVGNRRAALRLQRRIVDHVSVLADHPYLGRVVPEQGVETLRELLVWRYRIWYRVHADGIDVLCIWDGRRGTLPDVLGESAVAYSAARE